MKSLVLVGDGIGNITQTLPAVHRLVRAGQDVHVMNVLPTNPAVMPLLFSGLVGAVYRSPMDAGKGFEGQYLMLGTSGRRRPGIQVRGSALFTPGEGISEVRANLLATRLPIKDDDLRPVMPPEIERIKPLDSPDIVVSNGRNRSSEVWEAKTYARWPELIARIKRAGYTVGSVGLPADMLPRTIDLSSRSLARTLARCKGARLLITNDTGLYHLACLMGVPVIVIFTFTSTEKNYDPVFHASARVVGPGLECAPCQHRTRGHYWLKNRLSCGWACRSSSAERIAHLAHRILEGEE